MSHNKELLSGIAQSSKIIEVGPSYRPLAAKAAGWNAFTIDHADRAGLVAKYAEDPTVDTSRIEEVDFVWTGGPLSAAVPEPQHGTFDAFIASHVIEHTTDVVEFLKSAEALISDGGAIILVVPDKRKCFDAFRPLSTTGDAIVAHRERRSRHTAKIHFDYAAMMIGKGQSAWSIDDDRKPDFIVPFDQTLAFMERASVGDYIDAHQWVFVPASFELMLLELGALGMLNLRIERIEEALDTEFYVWLRKGREQIGPKDLADRRLELMNRSVVELAEQSRQVPGSHLHRRFNMRRLKARLKQRVARALRL